MTLNTVQIFDILYNDTEEQILQYIEYVFNLDNIDMVVDCNGFTPLDIAVLRNQHNVVNSLLCLGACPFKMRYASTTLDNYNKYINIKLVSLSEHDQIRVYKHVSKLLYDTLLHSLEPLL